MKKLKKIILNLLGLGLVILLFNFPTFNKMKPQSSEPVMIYRDMPQVVRDYPETIEEMQRDMETGKMMRSLTPSQRRTVPPLKTIEETWAEREYTPPEMENGDDPPPEFGQPKNGDPQDHVIVQIINALGNNMAKIMGGVVALSQALLNFRTFRNRKKAIL